MPYFDCAFVKRRNFFVQFSFYAITYTILVEMLQVKTSATAWSSLFGLLTNSKWDYRINRNGIIPKDGSAINSINVNVGSARTLAKMQFE